MLRADMGRGNFGKAAARLSAEDDAIKIGADEYDRESGIISRCQEATTARHLAEINWFYLD